MVLRSPDISEFNELIKRVEKLENIINELTKTNKQLRDEMDTHINQAEIHFKRYAM